MIFINPMPYSNLLQLTALANKPPQFPYPCESILKIRRFRKNYMTILNCHRRPNRKQILASPHCSVSNLRILLCYTPEKKNSIFEV